MPRFERSEKTPALNRRKMRMKKEIERLETDPPPGVMCWPKGDTVTDLEAVITGPEGSPYEQGDFRYPIDPPNITFITKIYHPNVDSAGRICLDTLVPDPKGQWKPSLNLSVALQSIRLLLSNPNPDDPLEAEISEEFKNNPTQFKANARAWTQKYASSNQATITSAVSNVSEELKVESSTTTKKRARDELPDEAGKKLDGLDDEEDEIIVSKATKTRSLRLAPKPTPHPAANAAPPPAKKAKITEAECDGNTAKKPLEKSDTTVKTPAKSVFAPPSKLLRTANVAPPPQSAKATEASSAPTKVMKQSLELSDEDEDDLGLSSLPLPPPKAAAPPPKKTFSLSLSKK